MKLQILIILLFLPVANAAVFSVGVSPNTVVVNDISPGETSIVKFSIFSVSDEPLLVYLSAENGNFDFFNKGYAEHKSEFSEESASPWVEFLNNPVEINPEERKAGRGWVDINLLLHVPENAEPGYHVVQISPMPTVFGQTPGQVGTALVTIAQVSILFNVKGGARREGLILDTTADGYSKYGFHLKTFFQNTGTLTLHARAANKIYDTNDTFLGEFISGSDYVKPGNTFAYDTPVQVPFPDGAYKVESKVTFTTGEADKNSTINVYAPITGVAVAAPQGEFPWLLVLLVVIIIIIIIAARWLLEKRR